ncbi:TetR/AcrR family transcriptional regulator [Nocardia vaccinii]|uniref:TetR/AcrR family transcriptional regulator n=1 Tax=Nocardia vaccinii TaxID=1822 RepID=UPI000829B71A|nr:TetR/AcrR family transcriptional regulator [Nocardia vaccinii]
MDRRIRRTRELLHRALIELMLERGYARVTVQDIIDRADVGRSTFYAHFRDKDDLLVVSSTEYLRRAVAGATPATGSPLAPAHTMLRLAADHPELYRALIGPRSPAVLIRATQQMVAKTLTTHLTSRLDLPDDELADIVTFLSWGLLGLIDSVTDPAHPTPADAAYHRLMSLAGPGLTRHVRQSRPDPDEPGDEAAASAHG